MIGLHNIVQVWENPDYTDANLLVLLDSPQQFPTICKSEYLDFRYASNVGIPSRGYHPALLVRRFQKELKFKDGAFKTGKKVLPTSAGLQKFYQNWNCT